MIEKTNKRNENGVKSSCDLFRTFNGAHFMSWGFALPGVIEAYRAGGVRCRRIGFDIFIHHEDKDRAAEIDANVRRQHDEAA